MTVEQILTRYGLEVRCLGEHDPDPKGSTFGPRGVGLIWPNTVVVPFKDWALTKSGRKIRAAESLHEGLHLVYATSPEDISDDGEEEGLLQLEYAAEKLLGPKDRKLVREYRGITAVGEPPYLYVGDYKRPWQTKWWREGFKLAVERGVLTPDGQLTWRRRTKRN